MGELARFVRTRLAKWDGPEDAWSYFTPYRDPRMRDTVASGASRSWPLTFHSAEGVRELWKWLRGFAGETGTVRAWVGEDGVAVDSWQDLLAKPEVERTAVTFSAFPPAQEEDLDAVGVRYREIEIRMSASASGDSFVECQCFMPSQPGPGVYGARDFVRFFDRYCRPMTSPERRRGAPVAIARTEPELQAEERARKLRLQSWAGGTTGGIVSGVVAAVIVYWILPR